MQAYIYAAVPPGDLWRNLAFNFARFKRADRIRHLGDQSHSSVAKQSKYNASTTVADEEEEALNRAVRGYQKKLDQEPIQHH